MKYDGLLFDLDGTLVDNSEGITKSTQFALDSYGYPNQPMETLKKFIGPPLWSNMNRLWNSTAFPKSRRLRR